MSSNLSDPPLRTSLVDPPDDPKSPDAVWAITRVWNQWLLSLTTRIQQSAPLLKVVSLTNQSASLTTTAIPAGTLSAGLYRVSWYLRVTQAASTSSALTVTISHTDGVSPSQSGAAVTGNTTTTAQSGSVIALIDQATAISYATTYASVGGTPMQYKLSIALEQVN